MARPEKPKEQENYLTKTSQCIGNCLLRMKNSNLKLLSALLAVALIAGVTLFSCKKEEKVRSLTNELAALNNEIYSQIETKQPSKGFWGKVGQICATVGADALGAYEGGKLGGMIGGCIGGPHGALIGAGVGGVICGAGASYGAYVGCSKSISDPYPNGYISTLSSRYSNFNISGKKHNTYLDLLFKNDGYMDKQTVYSQIFSDMSSLDIAIYNQIFEEVGPNSENASKMSTLINNYIRSDYNIDGFLRDHSEMFEMPRNPEEIWDSFFAMFSTITNINDAYFGIEKYIDFIKESGEEFLTNEQIEQFYCAFSVALHSTNYWSVLTNE